MDDEGIMGATTYVLDCNEVRADERYVVNLTEHANDTGVIDARNEHGEEVSQ